METSAERPPPIMTDFVRDTLNLSCIAAMNVSTNEINDDSPAKTSEPKNNTPKSSLKPGNEFIISGNTTNAKPIPAVATSSIGTFDCVAINPNAAKTPMPAKSSTLELAKAAMKALLLMSDFLGK